MYKFRLHDAELSQKQTEDKILPGKLEFSIVTKEEGCDAKRFNKIKIPEHQSTLRKPMNAFMMFRALVRKPIMNLKLDLEFVEVSKLSSLLWAKRTSEVENYMKYLARQDELYWSRRYDIESCVKKSKKKKLQKHRNSRVFISGDEEEDSKKLFKHYKVHKSDSKTVFQRPQKRRVQDVFISQNPT